jgi:hypothetical protein
MTHIRIKVWRIHIKERFYSVPASDDVLWEDAWMSDNIIASSLESLNLLEFKVRLVELESYDFMKK